MIVSVLVRRLRPGVTFEQFKEAWLAEPHHFGRPVRVSHALRLDDPREVVSYAVIDASREEVEAVLAGVSVAAGERARHDRVEALIEETVVKGVYEVVDTTELS
ncbi:hypothetical protein ACWEQL_09650 [Kitasatospora sp. NPDC004240]